MNAFDLYIFLHVCYTVTKSLKISGILGLGVEIRAMCDFFFFSKQQSLSIIWIII